MNFLVILGCLVCYTSALEVNKQRGECYIDFQVNKLKNRVITTHSSFFTDSMEYDLLRAINVPLDDGIMLEIGMNGTTAYGIKSYADVKVPRRLILPKKLREFCILMTLRLDSRMGGYIFSIVNALNTIIQLGVFSTSVINDAWNITLIHSDYNKHMSSQSIASVSLPFDRDWIEIAINILREEISIYQNGIQKGYFLVKRNPSDLVFDLDSMLYLGQAGPIIKGNFEVSNDFYFSYTVVLFKFIIDLFYRELYNV